MFAYVDESGKIGNHLFDLNQTAPYYGVLICRKDVDVVAEPVLERQRGRVVSGVVRGSSVSFDFTKKRGIGLE